jgi:glyceraldehyde 3-phosphate dehydrogenase
MGRIGRLLFRRLVADERFTLVAINDIMGSGNLAYLLHYDSLYGTYSEPVVYRNGVISTKGRDVIALQHADPSQINWKELDIDFVLECSEDLQTGKELENISPRERGKVLLSTTGSDDIPLMIYGFNHHQLNIDTKIISPGDA